MRANVKANIDFIGQLPEMDDVGSEDRNDYRAVPSSDRGNASYRDRGGFGTWQNDAGQRPDPAGTKHFTGYGVEEADLVRGFCDPAIRDDPAYTQENYKYRSTQPMATDLDEGGDAMRDDYAMRRKNERSRGFLTRPHIPTDR